MYNYSLGQGVDGRKRGWLIDRRISGDCVCGREPRQNIWLCAHPATFPLLAKGACTRRGQAGNFLSEFLQRNYIGKGKKEVRIWESSLKLKDMSLNPAAGGHICQPLVGERLNANPAPKCGGEEVFSNPLMEQTPWLQRRVRAAAKFQSYCM